MGSGGTMVDTGLSPNLSDVGTSQPRGIFHAAPCLWEGKQSATLAVQELLQAHRDNNHVALGHKRLSGREQDGTEAL